MTDKDIIETLDNIANALFDIEIKARYSMKMSKVLEALSVVRTELANKETRKDDELKLNLV